MGERPDSPAATRQRRGHIITVGLPDPRALVEGWIIEGADVGVDFRHDPPLIGGYTTDELYAVWLYHDGVGEPSV